jgi:uncharacterized protein (TIGR02246 family)
MRQISRSVTRMIPLTLFALATACSNSPDLTAIQAEPDVTTAASIGSIPGDTQGIEALKSAWDAAWAAKDAAAYAANYAVDADFVNPLGGVVPGREAIRAVHQMLFAGAFAPTTSTSVIRRTVFLTGTLAVVDLNVTLSGVVGTPPGLIPTEPGIVRTRARWVAVKRAGQWQIHAQQLTALPPQQPQF